MKQEKLNLLNTEIRAESVRLIGDNFEDFFEILNVEIQPGKVWKFRTALDFAKKLNLDLVQISNDEIPLCKIVDYKKFLYDQKKLAKDREKNQKKVIWKEIKLTSTTDVNDLKRLAHDSVKHLCDGAKIKLSCLYKGRHIVYKEHGEDRLWYIVKNIKDELNELPTPLGDKIVIEQLPKLEGKTMNMLISKKS